VIDAVLSRVVAGYALFLEFSDDETLDPKLAVSMLEGLEAELRQLAPDDRERFSLLLNEIAAGLDDPARAEFLRSL
jgi:hypothetical protein